MKPRQIVILTGQSGSGKSTAVRVLEDQGFYCIDNLPVSIVPELVQTLPDTASTARVALVIDARNPASLKGAPALVAQLRAKHEVRVVYFEAREEALLRRYSETRRRHPPSSRRNEPGPDHVLPGRHGRGAVPDGHAAARRV